MLSSNNCPVFFLDKSTLNSDASTDLASVRYIRMYPLEHTDPNLFDVCQFADVMMQVDDISLIVAPDCQSRCR